MLNRGVCVLVSVYAPVFVDAVVFVYVHARGWWFIAYVDVVCLCRPVGQPPCLRLSWSVYWSVCRPSSYACFSLSLSLSESCSLSGSVFAIGSFLAAAACQLSNFCRGRTG